MVGEREGQYLPAVTRLCVFLFFVLFFLRGCLGFPPPLFIKPSRGQAQGIQHERYRLSLSPQSFYSLVRLRKTAQLPNH